MALAYPSMKAGSDWHIPFFDNLMKNYGINTFVFNFKEPATLEFNPILDNELVVWNPVVN